MKRKTPIAELLRWRFKLAKSEAPSRPSAAHLLDHAPAWWERWPEKFQSLIVQLKQIQFAEDQQMTKSGRRKRPPVTALLVFGTKKLKNFVPVQYFRFYGGKLSFCFKLEPEIAVTETTAEVTFVSDIGARPLLCALATVSQDGKCRVNTELPANLVRDWGKLKPPDPLPFRLILHFKTNA